MLELIGSGVPVRRVVECIEARDVLDSDDRLRGPGRRAREGRADEREDDNSDPLHYPPRGLSRAKVSSRVLRMHRAKARSKTVSNITWRYLGESGP